MTTNENGRLSGDMAAAKEQTKAHTDSLPVSITAQGYADDLTTFDDLFDRILRELRALYGYATSPQEVAHHRRLEALLDALHLSVVGTVDVPFVPFVMPWLDDPADDADEPGAPMNWSTYEVDA